MNRLPESPRKMLAGWKLYRKNPSMAPANTAERRDISGVCLITDTAKIIIVENNAEPADNPSSPSIRLNAFVIKRTQMIVRGRATAIPKGWRGEYATNKWIPKPDKYSQTAATVCTPNFTYGPSGTRSSYKPKTKIRAAGRRIPRALRLDRAESKIRSPNTQTATAVTSKKLRKIETPPIRGTGRAWKCRPAFGLSSHPRRTAVSRIHLVSTRDTATAAKKAAM